MMMLVTANGVKHGLINEVGNSSTSNDFKHFSPEDKIKMEKQKKYDSKIVKAQYLNSRGPTECMDKTYCKYAGDKIQSWHCIHGQIYDMPLGLVEEVNNNPGLARRSEVVDASGKPTIKDGEPEKLHRLIPVGF